MHLWKAQPLQCGLSFLPTFHVMVVPSDNDPTGRTYTVQLMTYMGKVVMEDQIMVDSSGQVCCNTFYTRHRLTLKCHLTHPNPSRGF